MACNWSHRDYFTQLMCKDRQSHTALEMFVNDLHSDKERTVLTFLCHSGSEDFLWNLVQLLGNDITRVAGNAAYIIGTLAEFELGCYRIISLAKSHHPGSRNILSDLTRMLSFDDPESVMNAAGTLGTLAENTGGREWMLSESCVESMLDHVTELLHNENLWTASNAALVLARLSISEEGSSRILKHPRSQYILTCLIQALGADVAGRGMNAAFAVGRLCDMESGRQALLNFPESEKMISALVKMLSCEDAGASKNACFALSCLAASLEGHSRLLNNPHSKDVLLTLSQLLITQDSETGWFAAMTLRTLASQPKGCLRLRELPQVCSTLKKVEQLADVNSDLKEEVLITLEILRPLNPPDAPNVSVVSPYTCCASWNNITTVCNFDIWYQLFEDSKCIYSGPMCQCEVNSLSPHKTYSFRVRAVNEIEESAFSEPTAITTEEDLPEMPQNLRILGTTVTQLKVGWSPPENFHGISKGYYVYQGKALVEHTTELSAIISGLAANTAYEIQVCAATVKGKGPRASCTGNTAELGAHAPGKPHVQVLGRNEVHVSWEPPEIPMGRITRYDVSMNGKIIYSGTELSCAAYRLTPDTEYSFVVTALTNEGKFESRATKKRTAKDEFDHDRPPLYQTPKKDEEPPKSINQKRRKSTNETKSGRVQSAKGSHASCNSDQSISAAASTVTSHETQGLVTKPDKDKEDTLPLQNLTQKTKLGAKDSSSKKENVIPRPNKELAPASSNRRSTSLTTDPHDLSSSSQTLKVYTSRINELSKPSSPVAVSYVSIHIRPDRSLELNAIGPNYPNEKTFIQSPPFCNNINHTLRVERSKTMIMQSNGRTNRPNKFCEIDSDNPVHKDQFTFHISDTICQPSCNTEDMRLTFPPSEKSVLLPKPVLPSSCYLDSSRRLSTTSGTSTVAHSISNRRASSDQEPGQDEVKPASLDFQYHRGRRKDGEQRSLVYTPPRLAADAEFYDMQRAFIHRTNTFTGSHRPALRKNQAKNVPVHLNRAASTSLNDSKLLAPVSHNKFVPVQLRTQPSHLTANQLQRVNTSLSETGRGGLSDQRLHSLPRNNTQVSLRLQPRTTTSNQRLDEHYQMV